MVINVVVKLHGHVLASDRPAEPSLQLDDLPQFAFVVYLKSMMFNPFPIQSALTTSTYVKLRPF